MRRKNWRSYIHAEEEKPSLSWDLVKRVLAYAKPYRWKTIGTLVSILIYTGLALLSPLILRHLIDVATPGKECQPADLSSSGTVSSPDHQRRLSDHYPPVEFPGRGRDHI